jgi:adenine phosphoribosyltransferase
LNLGERLRQRILDVPDFPKPGITFKDLTPIYLDPALFGSLVQEACTFARSVDAAALAAIEARGFLLGTAMACEMNLPLLLVRKKGKLPRKTYRETYSLEYGEDSLEVHQDQVPREKPVVIVDDLLATGGTARATSRLLAQGGARTAGFIFVVELGFLSGRKALGDAPIFAPVRF